MFVDFLQLAGNTLLQTDPLARERLAKMQGKVFKLELLVIDKELFFVPGADGIEIRDSFDGNADITLRGSPLAFAQFGLKQRGVSNKLFEDKRLVIEGDVELAQEFQYLLRDLEIDLEEILSRCTGDIVAHQVGRGARAFKHWADQAGAALKMNMREFLVEEGRILPPDWRVAQYLQAVDTLRADVDRLEQRVNRLMRTQ